MPRRIGILLYPDFQLLDAAGVTAAFEIADAFGDGAYDTTPLSRNGGLIRSSSGMALETFPLAKEGSFDTLVVVGGEGHKAAMACPELQAFLRYQAGAARRICSVCTGAFLLAAAGLLDGRRVTTHWQQAGALKARFPELRVSSDAIHIHDGSIWTSAGISAGIDMALALVTEDLGADIGRRTAQQMVVFYHRPGGQSQFSALLEMGSTQERFADLLGWIRSNLKQRLTVDILASQVGMSPRNFSRSFRTSVGMSPARAVERLRLEAARERAERSTLPIETIAVMTGFHDPERMRRAFLREFHQPPQAVRRNANGSPN
ncbi:GlxA family transcriptional regulator [Acetobacter oeni]|uniref:AraC family transcriptional regulator n=1 Tax=Acetobacter oeni TaxID=304077 RepID=A0A511XNY9_9PROT|nr:GlxA family transcriptional regulator [Acetobacter oeni]MBB3884440.1 transcriptional regulator GlxA family with amidase domain [Acetobacter oeni]NHO20384.1 helix-turn-helix domain-containing protein [Acetobacter oeni]GEN64675.1 AraC family transcriptional regulator [Acetobacter oeni]